jgi:hypothetical protein
VPEFRGIPGAIIADAQNSAAPCGVHCSVRLCVGFHCLR